MDINIAPLTFIDVWIVSCSTAIQWQHLYMALSLLSLDSWLLTGILGVIHSVYNVKIVPIATPNQSWSTFIKSNRKLNKKKTISN